MFIHKYNTCNKENCCTLCLLLMVERYQLGLAASMCFSIEAKHSLFPHAGVLRLRIYCSSYFFMDSSQWLPAPSYINNFTRWLKHYGFRMEYLQPENKIICLDTDLSSLYFKNRGNCFYQEGSELSYLNRNTRIFGRLNWYA